MALRHANWAHGVDVQLENRSWGALRQGFYTTVTPSNESLQGWVHFPIPTPVIVDGVRLKAGTALARVGTGSDATITAMHVWDGDKKIYENNGLNVKGGIQVIRFDIPGRPEVLWGTVICLNIKYNNTGSNAVAQMVSAGIDFY